MFIDDNVLKTDEKIIFSFRSLYSSYGYKPYSMSKFEESDLYAGNKEFLVSDNVLTFTDVGGKLMALKPDVTLSIIKNSSDIPNGIAKVYYNENVYRPSKSGDSFSEIMQAGVECFGKVGNEEICEVIILAAKSILTVSTDARLVISDLDVLSKIFGELSLTKSKSAKLITAIGNKNYHEADELLKDCPDRDTVKTLLSLIGVCKKAGEILPKLHDIPHTKKLIETLENLKNSEIFDILYVDFTVTDDINYYNGLIFKGFIPGIPENILSGGQYDRLMERLGRKSSAIGFAVYTDVIKNVDFYSVTPDDGYVNIALPKGRLGEKIYEIFANAGYECDAILEPNRKLIFENPEKRVRYFWVKPSDAGVYVERGAADIGVAGKDIIKEYSPDVYELLDLKKGKCRMAVAAPKSFTDNSEKTLRVATKFSNIAKEYYRSLGRDIDIIHLNGSIEIAPILGLSDVIVDIVETGTTLKENDLEVKTEIFNISARLIANKSAYKFKGEKIDKIVDGIKKILEG